MKIRTFFSLLFSGHFSLLLSVSRAIVPYQRVAFVASGLSNQILQLLTDGPQTLNKIAEEINIDEDSREGLEAWLELGVALGELRSGKNGYSLRGKLSRKLTQPANDAGAALVEETATLQNFVITQTPDRLKRSGKFSMTDQNAATVARSSRLIEPFVSEAVAGVIPKTGSVRLLEIGCGDGSYICHAADLNPELTAVGLELQEDAAELARKNIQNRHLSDRVSIETADIMQYASEPIFDVATLHSNIYYFPVDQRVKLLKHVCSLLKPGAQILLTTMCREGGAASRILNLWSTMTEGCGPLPEPTEMLAQFREVSLTEVNYKKLVPGEALYAFTGLRE